MSQEPVYIIFLKNGNTIETQDYDIDDGFISYRKYGISIRLEKKTVVKIEKKTTASEIDVIDYQPPIVTPVYYMVSGHPYKHNTVNGIYEQSPDENGYPTYVSVIGFNVLACKTDGRSKPYWSLYGGAYSSYRFYNAEIVQGHPDFKGVWFSGDNIQPAIKVIQTSPPESIYQGRYKIQALNFPSNECNGIYNPCDIYKGWITYKNSTGNFLIKASGRKSWLISYKGYNIYEGAIPDYCDWALPEQIDIWQDLKRRPLQAAVIKKYGKHNEASK